MNQNPKRIATSPVREFSLFKKSSSLPWHVLQFTSTKKIHMDQCEPSFLTRRKPPAVPVLSALPATQPVAKPASTPAEVMPVPTSAEVAKPTLPSADGTTTAAKTADTSLIAPYGGAAAHKARLFKKKTKEVHFMNESVRKTKIEEAVPWVFTHTTDDTDWVFTGQLQHQTCEYMAIVMTEEEGFQVTPVEKWYRFQAPSRSIPEETLPTSTGDAKGGANSENGLPWSLAAGTKSTPMDKLQRLLTSTTVSRIEEKEGHWDELDFDVNEAFQDDEEEVYGDLEEEQEGKKKEQKKLFALGYENEFMDQEEEIDSVTTSHQLQLPKKDLTKEGKALKRALVTSDRFIYDDEDEEEEEEEEEEGEGEGEREEEKESVEEEQSRKAVSIQSEELYPTIKTNEDQIDLKSSKPRKEEGDVSGSFKPRSPSPLLSTTLDLPMKRTSGEEVDVTFSSSSSSSSTNVPLPTPAKKLKSSEITTSSSSSSSDVITKEEMIHLIQTHKPTVEQLLHLIGKHRIVGSNRTIFLETAKAIAKKTADGKLILKSS